MTIFLKYSTIGIVSLLLSCFAGQRATASGEFQASTATIEVMRTSEASYRSAFGTSVVGELLSWTTRQAEVKPATARAGEPTRNAKTVIEPVGLITLVVADERLMAHVGAPGERSWAHS